MAFRSSSLEATSSQRYTHHFALVILASIRMNHLAIFTLSVLTAHSVCAQMAADWPKQTHFLSTPYYFYNHQVIPTQAKAPVLDQHDPFTPQRDAMISVLLRELKETNVVVENVKNELAQMKKMVEDKVGAEGSKSNGNNRSCGKTLASTNLLSS
ncbi:uncharacterized protein LOC123474143 [Daphnia magna]|uniref:uncharacterized protein LOC123474143 n=1 Tax=Daphnia magna TaxID=35525 RepID=UPI001E1BBE51|nr:uncharacterized protein LOC123474143 [Daphnia magna]